MASIPTCYKCGKTFSRQSSLTNHLYNLKVPCDVTKSTYKKASIPKAMKLALWNKYFPNSKIGECLACRRILYDDDFHAAHNLAEVNGGSTTLDNLRISCRLCNLSCGIKNFDEFAANMQASQQLEEKYTQPDIPLQIYSPPAENLTRGDFSVITENGNEIWTSITDIAKRTIDALRITQDGSIQAYKDTTCISILTSGYIRTFHNSCTSEMHVSRFLELCDSEKNNRIKNLYFTVIIIKLMSGDMDLLSDQMSMINLSPGI